MVSNKITEGVGKKIVDALKKQSDIEIQNVVENPVEIEQVPEEQPEVEYTTEEDDEQVQEAFEGQDAQENFVTPSMMSFSSLSVQKDSFANDLEDFDMPTNITVLKQLINQLPAGVSRQTGAQIIKQTMEALGISMKSVLQEAQQVQERLNTSSKDCQTSIVEYKKQITLLEKQSQKYQRQYTALNEVISLFIQTNL